MDTCTRVKRHRGGKKTQEPSCVPCERAIQSDTEEGGGEPDDDYGEPYIQDWLEPDAPRHRVLMVKEAILDALEVLHMRSESVASKTYDLFLQLDGHSKPFASGNRAKLAYAMWEALNREEIPRSVRVIADLFSVTPNSMLKVEKHYKLTSTFLEFSDYVKPICAFLSMRYPLTLVVLNIVKDIQDRFCGRQPETFIAAVIVKTFLWNENVIQISQHFDTTPQRMCEILGVNWKTVRLLAKKIPQYEELKEGRQWQLVEKDCV